MSINVSDLRLFYDQLPSDFPLLPSDFPGNPGAAWQIDRLHYDADGAVTHMTIGYGVAPYGFKTTLSISSRPDGLKLGPSGKPRCFSNGKCVNTTPTHLKLYDHSKCSTVTKKPHGGATASPKHPPCAVCSKPSSAKCGSCNAVHYCNRDCQVTHWKGGHKRTCVDKSTAAPKQKPPVATNAV